MNEPIQSARRVLVTGASGFVGRSVPALLLQRGYEVHLVGRPHIDVAATWPADVTARCHHHDTDLLAPAPWNQLIDEMRPTHLLHLAWYAQPGSYWTALENLDWVAASLRLVRAFAGAGGRRAVIAGTCAEYDWSHPFLEENVTPLAPSTLYGAAKAGLHRILDQAAQPLGVSMAWGHIFFPYGPWEKPRRLLSDVITGLLEGQPVPCSDGRQVRDFIYVEDLARAFVELLDSRVEGAVNMASGIGHPVREVVDIAARIIGRPDLVQFGAKSSPPNDPPTMRAAVQRLRNEVAFHPQFDLQQGLERTIEWWRNRLGQQ